MQIEKGSASVQKFVSLSSVLKHFSQTKLQRQVADVHAAFQVSSLPELEMGTRENTKNKDIESLRFMVVLGN